MLPSFLWTRKWFSTGHSEGLQCTKWCSSFSLSTKIYKEYNLGGRIYFYTWSNLELWAPNNSNYWCWEVILAEDSHNFPPQFIASRECRSFSHMRFSHAMEFEYTNDENYSLTGYNANKCAQTQKMATIVIG